MTHFLDLDYKGRFAPSPSGELHLGSLSTALASFLDAKAQQGSWYIRIENIDPPREQAGAETAILEALSLYGLTTNDTIVRQSERSEFYLQALQQLRENKQLFACACSTKQFKLYFKQQGFCPCRKKAIDFDQPAVSWRVPVSDKTIHFIDRRAGAISENLQQTIGDFVVRRSDGLFSYQLAVVVDDYLQQISHIVRGEDLLGATARQIHLQQLLNYPTPSYLHTPLVYDIHGYKLSKQNKSPSVEITEAKIVDNLISACHYLELSNMEQNSSSSTQSIASILAQATILWQNKWS